VTIGARRDAASGRRRAAAARSRVDTLTAGPAPGRHSDAATAPRATTNLEAADQVTAAAGRANVSASLAAALTGGDDDGRLVGVGRDHTGGGGTTAGVEGDRAADGDGDGAVRVEGLVAGWDPERAAVLDGLALRLPAGSRTAITGRSGCGKSTLAAVLAGLLAPRAGVVEVGGTAVLVGDETGHVFASTVRENLRLASPEATDPQLEAVLARVGLGWLALDVWLGTGGGTISGGQRRRLATARALLADPALLILDEPTEGIDEAGGRELMADLLDAASGRTVLVFAHRTEGLDLVDRTFELGLNGLRETGRDGKRARSDWSFKVGSWHGRPHPAPGTPF
jgi:ABC-type multidrug transport system fused ATPase/permease subunit